MAASNPTTCKTVQKRCPFVLLEQPVYECHDAGTGFCFRPTMNESSAFQEFWVAVAGVSAAIWLVTFAVIGFAVSSGDLLKGFMLRATRRFTVYYAVLLTNANIVAPLVTALHWLTPPGGRRFVDGGALIGDALAWFLVALAIVGFIVMRGHDRGSIRRSLTLTTLLALEVFISWRDLFGSEGWAANGAMTQLALALGIPMLMLAYVALRRDFPELVERLERSEAVEMQYEAFPHLVGSPHL